MHEICGLEVKYKEGKQLRVWRDRWLRPAKKVRDLLEPDESYGNARAAYAASLRKEAALDPESARELLEEFERRYRDDHDPNVQIEVSELDETT
jgi:hypothetical protein